MSSTAAMDEWFVMVCLNTVVPPYLESIAAQSKRRELEEELVIATTFPGFAAGSHQRRNGMRS
jgi:hypothetical protein